jgi:hypothetical protein
MKLAMSQIKLFIVKLLQNYEINSFKKPFVQEEAKLFDSIETKDVFFNGPLDKILINIKKINK